MRSSLYFAGVVSALAALSTPASAGTEIIPLGYVFDRYTDCGTFCYHDSAGAGALTGTQLIDGAVGVAGWGADLGNGGAYEWVGWLGDSPVNIDFDFVAKMRIGRIEIGTTQDDLTDVVLPSVDVYEWQGGAWVAAGSLNVPEDSANDRFWLSTDPHGFLTLDGLNINSDRVRLSLRFSYDGPWTFVDEVNFHAAPVPEPETYAMMLAGLGLLGAAARRKRQA